MKPSSTRPGATSLEALETRIAPARLIQVGAPDALSNDVNYVDSDPAQQFFVKTGTGTDQISMAVGGNADTYYIKLDAGDVMEVFNSSSSFNKYIEVTRGTIVAFFYDADHNKEVSDSELTGISVGTGASFEVRGAVQGDIVTNLDTTGGADTINMSSTISPAQDLVGVTIGGNGVNGAIISGGNIKTLVVNGNVGAILAGSAANFPDPNDPSQLPGRRIDFFPGVVGGEGRITFNPGEGVSGASIQSIVIDSVTERVQAGDGGFGAKGGALQGIEIIEDADGALLYAGDGGAAGGGKPKGGQGGSVKNVAYAPPDSGDASPNSIIEVRAGDGGASAAGKSGAGGSVSNVLVSFRLIGSEAFPTAQLVQDNVLIAAGAGGDGKIGGAGGKVSNSTVLTVTPDGATPGLELQVIGGAGGDTTVATGGGKTAAGGSISGVKVRNQFIGLGGGETSVVGGNGGLGNTTVNGAAGGKITNVELLGASVSVFGGDGSNGLKGGVGGALKGVLIDAGDSIFSTRGSVNAGSGGAGLAGSGGNGGKMSNIKVENGDFILLNVNEGDSANGGDAARGKGGAGGSVTGLDFFDSDLGVNSNGQLAIRTGEGGDGTTGAGAGGSLKKSRFSGIGISATVTSGAGGNVLGADAKGNGGAGGVISGFEIQADGFVNAVPASLSVVAGNGGNGGGASGNGGNGGGLVNVSGRSQGAIVLHSGDGGNGTTGKAGDGGAIKTSGGFATQSSGEIIAGDAGDLGTKPGRGGSITGTAANPVGLYAQTTLTVSAGDGSHGGAGGSLSHVGYGSTSSTLVPTPNGNIIIEAGDGSADGPAAGAGGSLRDVSGAVSSGDGTITIIRAGDGGSSFLAINVTETIQGDGGTQEVQTIDLSNVAVTPDATMVLNYGPSATTPLPVVPSATQTPADYAAQLQTALNALPGVTGVTVATTPTPNVYTITFNNPADQLLIGGTATVGTNAAAGGSVASVIIERGGGLESVLTIKAGDAGDAKTGSGQKGGSVSKVSVADIGATLLRSIAAGDGGDAPTRGGVGGSINGVDAADVDIGARFGARFGYETMGGLFAGAGGIATNTGVRAPSGSVTNISAESIASIVAGRALVPEAVERVDQVYLSGSFAIKESTGGILHNFPGTQVIVTVTDPSGPTVEQSAPIPAGLPASDSPRPDDNLLNDVEDILNAMATVQASGGVTVTGNFYNGYNVTFVQNGDQPLDFVAEEFFNLPSEETITGQNPLVVTVVRQGDDNPASQEVQAFQFDPTSSFVLSFGGDTTNPIASTASDDDVETELNALPAVQAVGNVTVDKDADNNRFVVTFGDSVAVDEFVDGLFATAVRPEVQTIDFFSLGEIAFTYGTDTTQRLAFDATPLDVQNAINALPSIIATGPNGAGGGVAVTSGPNGSYIIEFNTVGDKDAIIGTQFSDVAVAHTDGTATTPEVQVITVPPRTLYNPDLLPAENYVGAVADPLSLGGPTFQFVDFVSPSDPLDTNFEPEKGDIPIDGLIYAKTYVQEHTNFIPEARLVNGTFIDYKNNA